MRIGGNTSIYKKKRTSVLFFFAYVRLLICMKTLESVLDTTIDASDAMVEITSMFEDGQVEVSGKKLIVTYPVKAIVRNISLPSKSVLSHFDSIEFNYETRAHLPLRFPKGAIGGKNFFKNIRFNCTFAAQIDPDTGLEGMNIVIGKIRYIDGSEFQPYDDDRRMINYGKFNIKSSTPIYFAWSIGKLDKATGTIGDEARIWQSVNKQAISAAGEFLRRKPIREMTVKDFVGGLDARRCKVVFTYRNRIMEFVIDRDNLKGSGFRNVVETKDGFACICKDGVNIDSDLIDMIIARL